MKKIPIKQTKEIQQKLIKWFLENHRDLPWRKNYDPYEIWVSEIMLQQTQVTTVLPYFERWMKELPTIESVANAKEDTLLKLWEGLGYYSRVLNLQKAAKEIIEKHKGEFPEKHEEIIKLKGIGPYTAGAISSIAFNQEKPIVDGNVIRVLSRLFEYKENTRLPKNIKQIWTWAEDLIPKGNAREFNQGMMELGALICKPKNPHCLKCPLVSYCKAHQNNTALQLPNRGESAKNIPIKVAIAIIYKDNKIFIQKRKSKGLMAGLWEFPGGKVEPDETPQKAVNREIEEEMKIKLKNIKLFQRIKYGYTKFSVDLHCFTADYESGKIKLTAATQGKWVEIEKLRDYPFPAANVRLISKLMES